MLLYVYALRHRGLRRRPEEILETAPGYGRLIMRERQRGDHMMMVAHIYNRELKDVQDPLVQCRVVKINLGIQVAGTEYLGRAGPKSKATPFAQSWILTSTAEEARTWVGMIRPATPQSSTGFDPAEDDYQE